MVERFTKETFTHLVERNVRKDRVSYVEAIIDICKDNEIDPSDVPILFDDILKQRVKDESERLGATKKTRENRSDIQGTLF